MITLFMGKYILKSYFIYIINIDSPKEQQSQHAGQDSDHPQDQQITTFSTSGVILSLL